MAAQTTERPTPCSKPSPPWPPRFSAVLTLCAGLWSASPALADTPPVTSYARAYASAQLCGVGEAPNCLTSQLFSDSQRFTVTSGPFSTSAHVSSDFTPSGNVGAWASADLATGSLRLTVAGMGLAVGQPGQANAYGFGSGVAEFGDTINVRNLDGSAYQGQAASVLSASFDGGLYGGPESNLSFSATITVARTGYLAAIAAADYDTAYGLVISRSSTGWLYAGDALPSTPLAALVPGEINSFEWSVTSFGSFFFRQNDAGSDYAYIDLGHTIHVGLQTPLDTVFSAASGEFPGAVATPVPEPASWAFMLLSLPVLVLARRRFTA